MPSTPPPDFTSLSAGTYDTCGLRTDGTIRCWGDRFTGEYAPPTDEFVSVSVGVSDLCALTAAGRLYCISDGQFRLSHGDTFSSVSVGKDHVCGVSTNGNVLCWGEDDYGQASPPDGNFASVSVGDEHSCALTVDSAIVCWGRDHDGQSKPPSGKFSEVTVADQDSCGLTIEGAIECWGDNYGDRGQAPPGGTFVALSLGGNHGCAIAVDGFVLCWGRNDDGKGAPPHKEFISISLGRQHSCGVTVDGAALCWGDNSGGRASPETICSAIAVGDVDTVRQLLNNTATNCGGDPFIYKAITNRQPEVVRVLLEAGEDPNGTDSNGNPMLRRAVGWGIVEIVRLLVNAGADVNIVDTWGDSLLYTAVDEAEPETVRILLNAGADPDGGNRSGVSALELAYDPRNFSSSYRPAVHEIKWMLINAGATPDFTPMAPRITIVDRSDNSLTLKVSTSGVESHFAASRRNDTHSGTWTDFVTSDVDGHFEDRNLNGDTLYTYRVRACNAVGCSDPSDSASGLTEAVGPVDIPAAPSLAGSRVRRYVRAALDWTGVAGATYYEIYQDDMLERTVSAPQTNTIDFTPNSGYILFGGSTFKSTNYTVRACNKAGCSAHSNRIRLP